MSVKTFSVAAALVLTAASAQSAIVDVTMTGVVQFTELEWRGPLADIDVSDATIQRDDPITVTFSFDTDATEVFESGVFGLPATDERTITTFETQTRDFTLSFGDIQFDVPDVVLQQTYEVQTSTSPDRSYVRGRVQLNSSSPNFRFLTSEAFGREYWYSTTDASDGILPEFLVELPAAQEMFFIVYATIDESVFGVAQDVCAQDTCYLDGYFETFSAVVASDVIDGPGLGPIAPSPVPLPASAWLLLAGLGGLGVARRRV